MTDIDMVIDVDINIDKVKNHRSICTIRATSLSNDS